MSEEDKEEREKRTGDLSLKLGPAGGREVGGPGHGRLAGATQVPCRVKSAGAVHVYMRTYVRATVSH